MVVDAARAAVNSGSAAVSTFLVSTALQPPPDAELRRSASGGCIMTWDEIGDELESRGLRYYQSPDGPILIETWFKPDDGTAGQWEFVSHNSIWRGRGLSSDTTVYSFS
jgi:hypothetical protein